MRLLLVFQHFHPETGATQNRGMAMAEYFTEQGHQVHVITAKPNHPEGRIWPEFKKGWFNDRAHAGFSITHTWLYTRPAKSVSNRTLSYLSFMFMALLAGVRLRRRFDIVLASSPPPFLGISGWLLARLMRAKFVLDVRDLWPGLAVALGELKNPVAIWLARRLERFLYARADAIAAVTQPFCDEICSLTGPAKPIRLVMNGTTPEFLVTPEQRSATRAARGWEDRFVVMYAGNVGVCQGLPHLLHAAKRLERRQPKVLFQIVGNGPRKEHLLREAAALGLSNFEFIDRVALEEAIALMAGADALLVPLAASEKCSEFIPSKLFDSMAIGRPVLLSVDGEARRILQQASAGIYYPAGNAEALAEAVETLCKSPDAAVAMGVNGRNYAVTHALRSRQIEVLRVFLDQEFSPASLPAKISRYAKSA